MDSSSSESDINDTSQSSSSESDDISSDVGEGFVLESAEVM